MDQNKYFNALKSFKNELLKTYDCRVWSDEKRKWILREKFQEQYNTLEKLIKGNKPLELDELKIGMWVWDNKYKIYNKIAGFFTPTTIIFRLGMKVEYEKDRFYLIEQK